jgi:hypothetical protein
MINIQYYVGSIRYDIEDIVTSIKWSGDIKSASRELSLDVINVNESNWRHEILKFDPGHQIRFYYNGNELFRGIIFSTDKNEAGGQTLSVYDEGKYLTVNQDSRVFKNMTASGIVHKMCLDFGIPIGHIADTGFVIKNMIVRGEDLWTVFQKSLSMTKQMTGRKYWIYFKQGKLYLEQRNTSVSRWVIESGSNMTSASMTTSIENLRNSIKAVSGSIDDKKSITRVARDADSIKKYGLMQEVEDVSDMKSAALQSHAEKTLKEKNKPEIDISVSAIGYEQVISGRGVYAYDSLTGLTGGYYILQDTHNFGPNGEYTMDITLSKTDDLPLETLTPDEVDELNGKSKTDTTTKKTTTTTTKK